MSFDYNTSRKRLILPEYGRNIHMMVDYIKTIEDRDERNRLAHSVVAVMGNLNPHLRDINDFKHKLWDHLALIAKFDLDIDYPYDPPKPETFIEKPKKVEYGSHQIRYKHYGRSIELMVKATSELSEGEEKDKVINMIANHMKKAYLSWNRENVDNEVILKDLQEMAGGNIDISKITLTETKELMNKGKRKRSFKKNR
ncbi:MAG TPA: DUF4290 domain-containing protein [Bacteroidales bacterium]|jgi:hypothetical protein|nr:DUF4290 domain-containing protein [Bacteroidales bacterium]